MVIAQLLRIDLPNPPLIEAYGSKTKINPKFMWFRIVYMDSYLSIMLGLPHGGQETNMENDVPGETPTSAELARTAPDIVRSSSLVFFISSFCLALYFSSQVTSFHENIFVAGGSVLLPQGWSGCVGGSGAFPARCLRRVIPQEEEGTAHQPHEMSLTLVFSGRLRVARYYCPITPRTVSSTSLPCCCFHTEPKTGFSLFCLSTCSFPPWTPAISQQRVPS